MSAGSRRASVRTCRAALVYDLSDDVELDQFLRDTLGSDGMHVRDCDGGASAPHSDAIGVPDLIVLDVTDVDGPDVRDAQWRRHDNVAVIVVTRRPDATAPIAGVDRGADGDSREPIVIGDLRIDRSSRKVSVGGRPVELARREFDLLAHLASHPGTVFSRDELLRNVWGSSAEWQVPATVTEHVRRIRLKIETDPADPKLIHNVRGVGYRFGS